MKILIFSDLHLHTWKYGSYITDSGYNSRLLSQVNVLDQINKFADTNNIDHILFGGDLFHTHSSIPTQALSAAVQCFAMMSNKKIIALLGNHDMSNKAGNIHSLQWLREYATVVEWSSTIEFGESVIHALPYTESEEELQTHLKNTPRDSILLLHQGVAGVPMGSGFVINEMLRPDMLDKVHCKAAFAGHYHTHKIVNEKLTVIGSPMQHTWGDVGEARGWIVYDTNTGVSKHYQSIAPEFRILDCGQSNIALGGAPPHFPIQNNFIRLINWIGDRDEIRQILKTQGAASIEFELSRDLRKEGTDIPVPEKEFDIETLVKEYENLPMTKQCKDIGKAIREGKSYRSES